MNANRSHAIVLAVALLVATGAWAQEHTQFDEHDRQVTRDWYNQHQSHPPRGLRPQDRVTPEQESRLAPGQPFSRDLRQQAHYVPSDLKHRLPPPPPHHSYLTVGGHVALVDGQHHIVRDVIHLHDDNRH
jgi:Ni/Co efflux regulator RcnB